MTKPTYKFIGKDGSMGLQNGRKYPLVVREANAIERLRGWAVVVQSPVKCPYSSYLKFYENWRIIRNF